MGPLPADTVRGVSDDAASLHDFALRRTSIHRRHGDPFPLPRLREELGTSSAATSLRQRADDAFKTLNELAAVPFDQTDRTSSTPLTQVQSWMVEDILRRITQHGPAPEMSGQAALDEIVSSDYLYAQEANHLVEFDISRSKVLQRKAEPSLTVDLSSTEARTYLDNFRDLIERPAHELESPELQSSMPTPYWDPRLKKSRARRVELYQSLSRCSLLCFRRRVKAQAAFFTVKKKDNYHQRLIIDARQANACHRRPPTTKLATPAGLLSLDMSPDTLQGNGFGEVTYGGRPLGSQPSAETGDVGDCFYNFLVPQMASWFGLGDWFTGSELRALGMHPGQIFDDDLQGLSDLGDDEKVCACFCGMAMGWSWSLYLANEAVVHQASLAGGGGQEDVIRDKTPPPFVQAHKPAVGVYVDNVQIFGGDVGQASRRMDGIANRFSELGIPYEVDEVDGKLEVESLGMRFDFNGRVAATPKPSKTWRLWLATRQLMSRGKIHGRAMQIWLGHVTHHFALAKSCMACLSACYRFAEDHKHHRSQVWPSVRKEMRQVLSLLFLVEYDLSASTCPEVHLGDSADYGYSLMVTSASHEDIRAELRYKERWRFIVSDEPLPGEPVPLPDHVETEGKCDVQQFHHLGSTFEPGVAQQTTYGQQLKKKMFDPAWIEWVSRKQRNMAVPVPRPQRSMVHGPGIPAISQKWDSPSRWKLLVARRWDRPQEHINVKEAKVVLMGLRRICRTTKNLGQVCLSLSDNLVSCLAFEKGRSSSGTLNGVLRRATAYVMAGRLQWRLRHIPTDRNAADEASRWFQPKGEKNRRPLDIPDDGHVLMTDFESGGTSSSSSSSPLRLGARQRERKGFFLEIFSGTARLTSHMRSAGIACLPDVEIGRGQHFNLLRKSTQRCLLQMILEGKIVYLHCGTPCTVFSRARHNIKHLARARQKEAEGISLALFTVLAVRNMINVGGYFSIENPQSSTLWQFGPIHDLFKLKDVAFIVWHMCEYGASCKKPTGLLTNIRGLSGLAKRCSGGHQHVPLRGTERVWEDGAWITRNRTRGAGAYPLELCKQWVSLVQESIGQLFASSEGCQHECQHFERRLQKATAPKRVLGQRPSKSIAGGGKDGEDSELTTREARDYIKKHPVIFGHFTKDQVRQLNQQKE